MVRSGEEQFKGKKNPMSTTRCLEPIRLKIRL